MNSYLAAAIAVMILANLAFTLAVKMKRNDIADVVWGFGFVVATAAALFWTSAELGKFEMWPRMAVAGICLAIWAGRLSTHIAFRNAKKSGEDVRYKNWRDEWGSSWKWKSYLRVFILQGLILIVNALPLLKIASEPGAGVDLVVWIGVVIWAVGFFFEAWGDHQLTVFKGDPKNKGKLMTTGLWSWTRHPNYFGEVVQWWGFFLMAVTLPGAWFTVIAPIAITFLILKVSGVPMLEKEMKSRPGFDDYARQTPSTFFPLPPKKA
ncbi:MAG: DUF1295 domain-containing protein [Bdellovibrionota bacterium]